MVGFQVTPMCSSYNWIYLWIQFFFLYCYLHIQSRSSGSFCCGAGHLRFVLASTICKFSGLFLAVITRIIIKIIVVARPRANDSALYTCMPSSFSSLVTRIRVHLIRAWASWAIRVESAVSGVVADITGIESLALWSFVRQRTKHVWCLMQHPSLFSVEQRWKSEYYSMHNARGCSSISLWQALNKASLIHHVIHFLTFRPF